MSAIDLGTLNPAQLQATLTTEGPLLVLAGAGSGKTRVLTYRIAHIVESEGVSPYQILAITFTNKAAAEMRARLGQLLLHGTRGMWVSTFHSMCVRLLRADAARVGYSASFSIYDEYDLTRLLKEVMGELDIDDRQLSPNYVREVISRAKNELMSADDFEHQAVTHHQKTIARVYQRLQQRLRESDAMDFDDLLFNAWRLLAQNPEVLAAYQQRFLYILVDEYQDTNHAQYALTALLAAGHRNLMVVGDDDQSIYSWRGADIRNILEFEHDYPEAQVVKLEQNYRSTAHILNAANAVIAKNESRKPKHLFTDAAEGQKLKLYLASDERDEGRFIASEIMRLHRSGQPYADCAVFYRTNAQSRVLEDRLLSAGVPYRIIGGTRFFDRAEIRDVMAYLKAVVNWADDIATKRIVNTPRRGLGQKSITAIEAIAFEEEVPFQAACELILTQPGLTAKAREELGRFLQLLQDSRRYRGTLRDIVEMIIERSGYIEHLVADRTVENRSRIENVLEFYGVAAEYDAMLEQQQAEEAAAAEASVGAADAATDADTAADAADAADADPTADAATTPTADFLAPSFGETADSKLVAFMEWLALRSDLDSLDGESDYVTLMTVHSAKGLEYPTVFLAGMEDGLFPHFASMESPAEIEEERRLAYVAITRARELLYITHAQVRSIFGNITNNPRSMFISDIPSECIEILGVGSAGYSGLGWEKRGDRGGSYGLGTSGTSAEAEGRVYGAISDSARASSSSTSVQSGHSGDLSAEADSPDASQSQSVYGVPDKAGYFEVDDIIDHKVFGRGTILAIEKDTLSIHFEKLGETKNLITTYAPIVRVNSRKADSD
ncbi:MAG: UvrD-helicase domain-containing protein [Coriobacteriia bacterium]|nr:UvrD-helicase domain-containing protein [Coriobacteriia bacterium]